MLTPRRYQVPAVQALANTDLGHIVAKAGSGKTVMVALAIKMREVKEIRPLSVLWIAYTNELLDQGRKACEQAELLGTQSFACMQGLTEIPTDIDIVVVDECHHIASPTSKDVMRSTLVKKDGRWARTCITWGMTATPERDSDDEDITKIIGPCVYHVPEQAIKDAGGVLPARVVTVDYQQKGLSERIHEATVAYTQYWMHDEQIKRIAWRFALKLGVTENEKRDQFVSGLHSKFANTESCIVLVETVKQGKRIAELIPGAEVLYSGLGKKKRENILEGFRSGEVKAIVCTSLADEGLDCPIASVLILARVGRAKGRLEQRVGRVLRPYPGKQEGLIVDICDKTSKMLEVQHYRRTSLYKKWGFDVERC